MSDSIFARGRIGAPRAGLRFSALSFVVGLAVACSGGDVIDVPIEAIPLGVSGGQCVDRLKVEAPSAAACLYFETASCVLVADLAAISSDGCATEGACQISRDSWVKYCPPEAPDFDLETEEGQNVGASLFITQTNESDATGARPAFCSFVAPEGACNDSPRAGEGDGGCLARLDLGYEVSPEGALRPTEESLLSVSGFFQDAVGATSEEPLCPSVDREVCPSDSGSCTQVELEVRLAGIGVGDVLVRPDATRCGAPGCTQETRDGRQLELLFTAAGDAVVGELAASLGARGTCGPGVIDQAVSTATCTVTMNGSGQVTATFGYPVEVTVAGEGRVTASPSGLSGQAIDCASNQTCQDVFSRVADVTLTAVETLAGWQFTRWSGGPCDGDRQLTCTVRTDQAHRITASFGYALELDVNGPGSVTATPPGFTCLGPDPCILNYALGDAVVLTSSPAVDGVFVEWGLDCAGTALDGACMLMMDQERRASTVFAAEIKQRIVGGGVVDRTPEGLACNPEPIETCGAYLLGTTATLTASADADWSFLEWQNCGPDVEGTLCAVTVTEPVEVVGVFGRAFDLELAGNGVVSLSPPGRFACGASTRVTCAEVVEDGTTITLGATPDTGWALGTLGGCTPGGTAGTCDVVMDQPRTVDIDFGRELQVAVIGSGDVTSPSSAIDCGTTCRDVVGDGTTVRLDADPDPTWEFVRWQGCNPVAGTPRSCDVSMDGPRAVEAEFGRGFNVAIVGSGSVTSDPNGIACTEQAGSDCNELFPDGTNVTLTANPASGWDFRAWNGCTPVPNFPQQCTVVADQARTVTVEFGRELVVQTVGQGSVVSAAPATGINCGNDCDEVFLNGTDVTLQASPNNGWALVGFTGGCTQNGNNCVVDMNQRRTIVTTFGRNLNVTINGGGRITSTPGGINCGAGNSGDCAEAFPNGQDVVLDATPDAGWVFDAWSNCDSTQGPRCTVDLTAARTVSATFQRRLIVEVVGNGSVTSAPPGINCGSDCTEDYPDDTNVTLTANPANGWAFAAWLGCPSPSGATCSLTMDQEQVVRATFAQTRVLTVDVNGGGTVSSTPGGINCGADCIEPYVEGTAVALTATPNNNNWVFDSWQGCTPVTSNPCTVTMDVARTVTANFERPLTVQVNGSGSVSSNPAGIDCDTGNTNDCSQNYPNNTNVTLTAVPAAGWAFSAWTNCPSPSGATCTFSMNQARTVAATFVQTRALNMSIDGGGGSVTSNPAGINCGADCSEDFTDGTSVSLTASPNNNWAFREWTGCTPVNDNPCTVTMNAALNVTATFARPLTVSITGDGSVTSAPAGINCDTGNTGDCNELYDDDATITLTANPGANSVFGSWTNCTPVGGQPEQCTVQMTTAQDVTATFTAIQTLEIQMQGTGTGTVTFSQASREGTTLCGVDCSVTYLNGISVALTALPATNSTFTQYAGDCSSISGVVCTVNMTADLQVQPSFALQ